MIRIKYIPLFDVEFLHDFYASGKCNDFRIIPTAQTQSLLKQYRLIFRTSEHGFAVHSEVNTAAGTNVMMNPLAEKTKFTFLLILKNPNFVNFSDVALQTLPGQVYYFNNLANNLSGEGEPLLVKDASSKAVSDADLLKTVGKFYSYHYSAAYAKVTGEMRCIDADRVYSKELENNHNNFDFSFDTTQMPEGRAEFWVRGVKREDLYLINPFARENVYAIMDVFHTSTLPAAYSFLNPSDEIIGRQYKVKFHARSTVWRYIVNNRYGNNMPSPSIAKTSMPSMAFSKDPSSTIDKIILYSNTPQKLKEEPITGVRFLKNAGDPSSVLISNLPNPTTTLVKKEGTTFYSDILITV